MEKKNRLWIAIFLLPSILIFCLIYGASVVTLFGSSFTEWKLASKLEFTGISNYVNLFADKNFLKALSNTVIWALLQSTIHIFIGVTFALILSKKEFYWKFARTAYMIPNIICSAALGMVYLSIFNPKFGAVNNIIRALGVEDFSQNWFMDYSSAFFTVTITWLPFAGVVAILVLAEIAAIPEAILESAKIDGAGEFKTNIYVVLPLLKNIIGTCVIVAATSMLKNFDIIFMTTNGGPGNTTLNLPLYIYKTSMLENNYGYANTIGAFLILLGIVMLIVINKAFKLGQSDI
ncbi:carbohydrate ABC transporter membrane protein 1 (CUT1 family) [Ruminiclostridium sufflavum DSM 19573]|uniref:Carbohydrate ABC transporter membrane protein 1 (CUT1 family) n=1 Tax=Ruminiclostridium sufflavum DSM 19573 TaxID=1121337 RepID=A0A318XNE9_9FIRM|nr:sugar ABC transporter permease [Ruminiclostridium sufflavum]PYG88246.1 carbohydrate ABC transporter membrane protein 1 (CUT1 family) [Ruminiclostridium sufflavum DSM 19573]